jgi:hypothetical protein
VSGCSRASNSHSFLIDATAVRATCSHSSLVIDTHTHTHTHAPHLRSGTFARSVWGIAERLGIPRVLVDLRHTATHNELPSLASLRVAAAQVP